MIAFVDMAHDKRTYQFFQDTRNGRVLMAESQSADTIVAAVADYVARRLVERERAVTVDSRVAEGPRVSPQKRAGRRPGRSPGRARAPCTSPLLARASLFPSPNGQERDPGAGSCGGSAMC